MMEKITSYKGFNKDMTCRDFQYKEGESYEEPSAKACERGFHACEYPLDCLDYYSPNESVYHVVEQSGEISRHSDDTKVASTKIKIGAEINIAGLVKAAIEYTMKRVNPEAKADERLRSIIGNRLQRRIIGRRFRKRCCSVGISRKSQRRSGLVPCIS
nr:MAG TPA: hypothetical protein [Caudoviricetes sp.]